MGNTVTKGIGGVLRRRMAIAGLAAGMMLAAVPAAAMAWMSWDGIDPVIDLPTGHRVNIVVEWPAEYTCAVDTTQPIAISVALPANLAGATLVSESTGTFPCADGAHAITTATRITGDLANNGNVAQLNTLVPSEQGFPIRLRVSLDGAEVVTISGNSRVGITGAAPLG